MILTSNATQCANENKLSPSLFWQVVFGCRRAAHASCVCVCACILCAEDFLPMAGGRRDTQGPDEDTQNIYVCVCVGPLKIDARMKPGEIEPVKFLILNSHF